MARHNSRRGSSSRRGRHKRGAGPRVGAIPFVIGAIGAVGLLVAAFWWSNREAAASAIDEATLCPIATGAVAMTTILVDLTDPLSPAQHTQLMAWLDKEIDDAGRGTQFTMGVVSEDFANWGATAPLCKPQDSSTANALTQNSRLIEERYRERFLDPLRANIQSLVSASGANRSPIMESLQALVSDTPGFVTTEVPRRIVMITDLLQHSDVLSFYRGGDWDSFRRSAAYQRIGSTLHNADVQIYQVPRPTEGVKDPAVLEDFWLRYFERQGAHVPRVKRLGDL